MAQPKTLFDKVWDSHVVRQDADGPALIYIDLHLVHEVTSPQAFESISLSNRTVRRPDLTLATIDHAVPTTPREQGIEDPMSVKQIDTLRKNTASTGIRLFDIDDKRQGIVHVIGPEQGVTQPGMTIVCGDSHTATHGAFGALAFGIGTSEVEHVLATQTLQQRKAKSMAITVDGELPTGVTAKDIILAVIAEIGTAGRHRVCLRVPRIHHREPVDGRADDHLQHEHRGGCPRRSDRSGRDYVRVPQGSPDGTPRIGLGRRTRAVADTQNRRRCDLRRRSLSSMPPHSSHTCRGERTPAKHCRSRLRFRHRTT